MHAGTLRTREGHTYIIIGPEQSAKGFSAKFSICTETLVFSLQRFPLYGNKHNYVVATIAIQSFLSYTDNEGPESYFCTACDDSEFWSSGYNSSRDGTELSNKRETYCNLYFFKGYPLQTYCRMLKWNCVVYETNENNSEKCGSPDKGTTDAIV